MCGIVGCKLNRPLNQEDLERLRSMNDALLHRGPDGEGEFYDSEKGLFLGHRRLSILDLDPRSAQPMARDNLIITFNGEIYNYLEIQKKLAADFTFETTGDTEVVLRAWQKQKMYALDEFDGMFAFALWDGAHLFLATDHFGEKPLYIYRNDDGIYFSSEAAPLIRAFDLKFEPTKEEISDFLYLGYIRPGTTGIQGLWNIEPASLIEINPDGDLNIIKYWSPPVPENVRGKVRPFEKNEIKKVNDILCQSLERRLRADVPIGLFLSGGVDSSLVAALSARELGVELQTYTVGFSDSVDETHNAMRIANHFGLMHTCIDSREDDLWQEAPRHLAGIYGIPNDNMTALAVYQMCKAAKPFLTVALCGLGGDEIFYGYNKYETLYRLRHYYAHSGLISYFLRYCAKVYPKVSNIANLLQGNDDQKYLRIKNDKMSFYLNELVQPPKDVLIATTHDLVHRVQDYDLTMSMPQSYIPAVDRGSMRASVEVRTPFLSRDLVNYVASLDQRALIAFGQKNLLRSILANYMPLDLLYQGKQGFVFPASRYYRERNPEVPQVPGLSPSVIQNIWQQKDHPKLQQLMVRLSLLEQFYGR